MESTAVHVPPPLTRRTRKRNERRDRVYAAAVELFVEQGFEATSMDEIALRSGVARTTVFNHFPRKALFLDEWARRRRESAARSLDDADLAGRRLRELLGGYLAALAGLNVSTRVETAALMEVALRNGNTLLGHDLGGELADLVAATGARLRPSADPTQVGRLLSLGYYSAVVRWIHVEPAPFDLAAELAALLDTVLGGALDDRG
ncbi:MULTISPECIES: TetR/AcrR family transcriptional regulator [Pseudonocardia]|nr:MULTISPECIES: TetR/AcrR family transcriptional regulator [Pseudonocardia]BBF99178.1 TetR family transcriptional regulator [Pseudonocardia autotrophica]GEC28569.1 TetR family transcriptional regulator [Pseudonocardia saturnea]